MCPAKMCPAKMCPAKMCPAKMCPAKMCPAKMSRAKMSRANLRFPRHTRVTTGVDLALAGARIPTHRPVPRTG
ncbi:hypothetical protein MXD60_23955, partial [Frankia sp. AgB32]